MKSFFCFLAFMVLLSMAHSLPRGAVQTSENFNTEQMRSFQEKAALETAKEGKAQFINCSIIRDICNATGQTGVCNLVDAFCRFGK